MLASDLIARWAPGLTNPVRLALDPQGNIWVTEVAGRVTKLSATGERISSFGPGTGPSGLFTPRGIALDPQGDVHVTDAGISRVQKYSPQGQSLAVIGRDGSGAGEFREPSDVEVDVAGNIYVAGAGNNRVQKVSPTGQHLATWE